MNKFEENKMLWSNITYFVILLLFTTLRLLTSSGVINFNNKIGDYIFTLITQIGILFIVPLCLYRFCFKQKFKNIFSNFGYKKIDSKLIWFSFLLGIIVFLIILCTSTLFSTWLSLIGYEPISSYSTDEKTYSNFFEFLLGLLFVAILPGMFEEFSNRGMLLSGLSKGSKIRAIVLSGLLFGLMHLNINQFFYATISGMIMATLFFITKSIWPGVIVHFTNNAINTYLTFASDNSLFGSNFYKIIDLKFLSNVPVLKFIIYILCIAIIVMLFIYLITKICIHCKSKQVKKLINEVKHINDNQVKIDITNFNEVSKLLNFAKIDVKKVLSLMKDERVSSELLLTKLSQKIKNSSKINKLEFYKTILNDDNSLYKPNFFENFFLYSSVILGSLVTIATLIWGFL